MPEGTLNHYQKKRVKVLNVTLPSKLFYDQKHNTDGAETKRRLCSTSNSPEYWRENGDTGQGNEHLSASRVNKHLRNAQSQRKEACQHRISVCIC